MTFDLDTIIGVLVLTIIFFSLFGAFADASVPVNTILLEAQGEGYNGMLGVACVIRQRMDDRHLSADRVCTQPKQFSCYNKGYRIAQTNNETMQDAKRAWDASESLYKAFRSNLYCRKDCYPYWRERTEYRHAVGNHVFYYEAFGKEKRR